MKHLPPFVVSGFLAVAALAQSGPGIPRVQSADVQVTVTSVNEVFGYSYRITNPTSNTASIATIDLDISRSTTDLALSGEGVFNGPNFLTASSELVLQQSTV